MKRDSNFWKAFWKAKNKLPLLDVPDLFEEDEENQVIQDIDRVAQLIKYDSFVYADIPDNHPLKGNGKVVASYLYTCLVYFERVPIDVQLERPLLIASALGRLPGRSFGSRTWNASTTCSPYAGAVGLRLGRRRWQHNYKQGGVGLLLAAR